MSNTVSQQTIKPLMPSHITYALILLCLGFLWWQSSLWYEEYLVNKETIQVNQKLDQHITKLSSTINQSLHLLDSFSLYLEKNIAQKGELNSLSNKQLDRFLATLLTGDNDVRNFSVAPAGVIKYISPALGNEQALNLNILDDKRSSSSALAIRAIKQKKTVISHPTQLLQGGLGLIARKAIDYKGQFWGLVNVVLDIEPMLYKAGLNENERSLYLQLRDANNQIIYTNTQKDIRHIVTRPIKLADGYWTLYATPKVTDITNKLHFFRLTFATVILLFLAVFKDVSKSFNVKSYKFFFQKNTDHFNDNVNAEHPPSNIIALLITISIIFVASIFYLSIIQNKQQTNRDKLSQAAVLLKSKLNSQLKLNASFLKLVTDQIAKEELNRDAFQLFVSDYVKNHPGLMSITWTDESYVVNDIAPRENNQYLIGMALTLAEPKRASRLAFYTSKPAYTKPFMVIQGKYAFEHYLPIYNNDKFIGTISALYSIDQLLTFLTSIETKARYRVQLLDKKGNSLHSIDNGSSLNLSNTMSSPFDLSQNELWLKLTAFDNNEQSNTLLYSIVLFIGLCIALCFWWQYKVSLAHWSYTKSLQKDFKHFHNIALASPMAILMTNPITGDITFANEEANTLFNSLQKNLIGRQINDFYADHEEREKYIRLLNAEKKVDNFEMLARREDQTRFWASISSKLIVHDKQQVIISGIIDLSERKNNEQKLFHQANYDSLTGLPNRSLALDRIEQAIARAKRKKHGVALMMIDLDKFKQVNDSLGHSYGDILLQDVALKLQNYIRQEDTVARLGGDEFIVLIPDIEDQNTVHTIAEKILTLCEEPIYVQGHEINISASIGISMYPIDGADQQVLLKNADVAMYQSKDFGRNCYRFYTQKMSDTIKENLKIETLLRHALTNNEFTLFYQPLYDVGSLQIIGSEALIRWNNPILGQVSPETFIPLAESMGLIDEIGLWVLEEACQQAKLWQGKAHHPQFVAVNVSGHQFRQGTFVETVRRTLHALDLPANALELEITESILLDSTDKNCETLNVLHDMGIKLSIDDFGTGYSSLSYLRRFPFDTLKIDRSFIHDVTLVPEAAQIVSVIVSIAKILNLTVVAEGVELESQLEFLKELNCPVIQGFYLAKPMPAGELEQLIAENFSVNTC